MYSSVLICNLVLFYGGSRVFEARALFASFGRPLRLLKQAQQRPGKVSSVLPLRAWKRLSPERQGKTNPSSERRVCHRFITNTPLTSSLCSLFVVGGWLFHEVEQRRGTTNHQQL